MELTSIIPTKISLDTLASISEGNHAFYGRKVKKLTFQSKGNTLLLVYAHHGPKDNLVVTSQLTSPRDGELVISTHYENNIFTPLITLLTAVFVIGLIIVFTLKLFNFIVAGFAIGLPLFGFLLWFQLRENLKDHHLKSTQVIQKIILHNFS